MEDIEKVIKQTNEKNQEKVDWTKAWSKKYPVLATYKDKVDVEKYATVIENIRVYSDLENANMIVWGNYLENNQKKSFFTNTDSNQIASIEAIISHYAVKIEDNKAVFKGRSDALYNFLDHGIPLIQKQADVYVSEELKRLKNRRSMNLSVKVYVQNDLLKILCEFTEYNFGIDYYETHFLKEGFAVHTASLPQEMREIIETGCI